MSSSGGIGSTLTSGIQDIAGILPLLGTEQCSVQVSSALTRGYLYAAAAPMSIFGSLGVVNAGFKTLVSCFSFRGIEGAKILGNIGFEPQGENLSLIMVEAGKGKNSGRYIIDTRMDELIKGLNIDKKRIREVQISHKSAAWNVKMMAATALLSVFSITPYIYMNLGTNDLMKSTTWVFPCLRAAGGFITATLIQLLIQRRITILSNQYLSNRRLIKQDRLPNNKDVDSEAAVEPEPGHSKKYQMDALTWLLLFLLLIGLIASIVGYVGCFSVVQFSTQNDGPVSWVALEVGLSVIRLAIWAWNPVEDDAPPLEIILDLDEHKPLPTCNKDDEDISQYKMLPLTRARDFLKIITSFAGLIEPFRNPDLSLYYTLTRKRLSKKSVPADNHRNRDNGLENSEKHKLGEWALYITVFDHKERTTRVYTQENGNDTFYSIKSDAPLVDVGHYLLEVEIDVKIDHRGDPVSSDSNNLDSLRKHHQSILEHIQHRLGAGAVTEPYAIENPWTMQAEGTISKLQREEENGEGWKTAVKDWQEKEQKGEISLICDYFMHSSIERERRLLDEKRVKWIARRMEMITEETKERFQGKVGVEYRVDKQAVAKKPSTKLPEEVERHLLWERYMMELLLLYEVKEWEQLFWDKLKAFLARIGSVETKERLTREWRADCWKRLNSHMLATKKRLTDFKVETYYVGIIDAIGKRWASSISRFFGGDDNSNSISLHELKDEMYFQLDRPDHHEIRLRIENEMEDIKFRLKCGFESGRFDQFWDDDSVFRCRYSRSKWLYLSLDAPLEIYSHALTGNKNIIHITFNPYSASDVSRFPICDLPWVTSISWNSFGRPTIHHEALFIKSISCNDLIKFAEEIRPKLLEKKTFPPYIFTDADWSDMYSDKLGNKARVLISFHAPTSSQNIILRLKHSSREEGRILEVDLGSTASIQLNPSSKSALTIDDITLYPNPGPSESHLSFKPGWNDIVIKIAPNSNGTHDGHLLHDIELLDNASLDDPRNQIVNAD